MFIKQYYDNRKKIYFLTSDGILDNLGQSQIIPYLDGLSKKYKLQIISFEKKNNIKNKKFYNEVFDELKKKNISWKYFKYYDNKILKLFEYLYSITYINLSIIKNKNLIIHLRSYSAGIMLFPSIYILKLNIIFDMRGLWIHERVDRNYLNTSNYYYKFLLYLEKKLLDKSKIIITLTEEAKIFLKNKFQSQTNNKKIVVLRTYTKTKKFGFNSNNKNITFCYLGSDSNAYNLNKTLNAMVEISKNLNNVKFKFLINNNNKKFINTIQKSHLADPFYSIIQAKHHEVPDILRFCDIGIFYANENFSIKASFPTKIAEYIASGMPILCNNFNNDVSNIVLKNNLGVISNFQKDNIIADTSKVIQLLTTQNRVRIRNYAKKELDISIGINNYEKIYNSFF